MSDQDPRNAGTQETYLSAATTNHLSSKTDRRGDGDILAASAWSDANIGARLARLRAEYDAVQHPRRIGRQAIRAVADSMTVQQLVAAELRMDEVIGPARRTYPSPGVRRLALAQFLAEQWHIHESALMLQQMKEFPDVRRDLTLCAFRQGIADPADVAVGVLVWWLDPTCDTCSGHGFLPYPNRPTTLGTTRCPSCHGSKHAPIPFADDGRIIEAHITSSLARWRTATEQRLGRMPPAVTVRIIDSM